jgi:hypothetical protein
MEHFQMISRNCRIILRFLFKLIRTSGKPGRSGCGYNPISLSTIFFIAALFISLIGEAQTKNITGTVMDSVNRIPLPGVTVCAKSMSRCVLTDNDGKFQITVNENAKKITFTAEGYHPSSFPVTDSKEQHAVILMSKSYITMGEVTVKGKRKKYRNRNNPAVELIR